MPRSTRPRSVALVAAGALLLLARAAAACVTGVGAVALTVSDADRAATFYATVLDAVRESDARTHRFGLPARVVRVRIGDERLELVEFPTVAARPAPADARSNDRWFQHVAVVVRDMELAYARVNAHGVVHVSPWPQRLPDWNPVAGGIEAFYFRDPDGHALELIAFPPGKGDPRWQRPGDGLFLGIDHTAIAVADTGASLRFYRDVLGLRVAGESENWGLEQQRLNGVPGAHLRITGLRAAHGPGIELLEYRAPRTGRPYPGDARPTDLLHWDTTLVTPDVAATLQRLDAAGARRVGSGATAVRDPDGHALVIDAAPRPRGDDPGPPPR